MTTDKKTLADAQPGGRVRLGDAPWPEIDAILADAYSAGAEGLPFEGIARRAAVRAAVAALSAQPSPGGQDAMADAARRVISDVDSGDYGGTISMATYDALVAALSARQPVGDQHPDDLAVDAFAAAMKAKMAEARAKGRGGWEDPAQCTAEDLSRMLRDHVEKGDPRDVANFCMMLHQRGEAIVARQPVGEPVGYATYRDGRFGSWLFQTRAMAESHDSTAVAGGPANSEIVPLFRSPAQAVDLGQFRRPIEEWRSDMQQWVEGHGDYDGVFAKDIAEANRLLALIDSQAVGK
ncbi:hypothetical protein [Stenotrophomonas geniculata]|uniref:hypothetical protein n=1 Tax=Stenotrophomonas geniculata TaxID=86188 RepID=UPI0039C5FB8A